GIARPLGDEVDQPTEVEEDAPPAGDVGHQRRDPPEQFVELGSERPARVEPCEVHLQPAVAFGGEHRPPPASSAAAALPDRTAPSTQGCTSQSPANTIGGRWPKPATRRK